jgi:RND family efflux transporter MFP subunit
MARNSCIFGALLVTLGSMAGCGSQAEPMMPPPPKVSVATPICREVGDAAEATGRAEAKETYEVRVRVKGYLQSFKFREGALVKKGDLLYEIDPRTFQADLESAEAELARVEAMVRQTRSEADRAARLRQSRAVSEEEYYQKVANQDTTAANLRKAQAAVETAKLELSFTKIVSPIDGMISRTNVTEGNLVGYNEPTWLTTVVRLDPIYVYFDIPERTLLEYERLVRDNSATALDGKVPVCVGLAIDKGFPHNGFIDFRDNKVDAGTGTIRVRAVIDNKLGILTPGLFCRVKMPIGRPQKRLLVPENALGQDQRGRYVMVVGSDDTVEARTVKVGMMTEDGMAVVESGLKADDSVIVNGLQRARPGAKVDPHRVPVGATSEGTK